MMMAERPDIGRLVLDVNPKKGKALESALTMSTISSISIVLPEATEKTISAPSSPSREERRSKGIFKHLPRPKSPLPRRKHSHSDPERTPSPQPPSSNRPRWLANLRRKKKNNDSNGATTPGDGTSPTPSPCGSANSLCGQEAKSLSSIPQIPPSATSMDQLPGTMKKTDSGSCIPVIMVSSHSGGAEDEEQFRTSGSSVSFEDMNGETSAAATAEHLTRKLSQSSQKSVCSSTLQSVGTSGVGSLLSPSGDESYANSDLDSPMSPLSRASSFGAAEEGHQSDTDPIETDLHPSLTSPVSDPELQPPTKDSPNDFSPTSSSKKQLKKKKKDKQTPWTKVRNAMKAWSPFSIQFKKKYYPWVQLAGHEGNFRAGQECGTIMKKSDANERNALKAIMDDILRPFVPEFKKVVEQDGDMYVEMTDLLREFDEPAVMDIKMGVRTYLEEELVKARTKKELRPDMYQKMIDVDPHEPTPDEHAAKAITKPRYMQWRESLSSSSTLGFRIEGIKTTGGKALKDFKTTRERGDVKQALLTFISENPSVKAPMYKRLLEIRAACERSKFFMSHELIGSSLLFVYDSSGLAGIHMIDFGKTVPLPPGVTVDHRSEWIEGNHEDGYLWGLNNLIELWRTL